MDGTPHNPQETVAVAAVAQACLRKCGNDIHAAQKMLEGIVRGHPPLYHNLLDPMLGQACYDALRSVVRVDRQKIWTAPNYTKGGNGKRLESMAHTLLDFPLPNGTIMRNATRDDLIDAAEFYTKQAKDMAHKGAWMQAIAARVGKKTVGAKFSVEQLQALREATA